MFFRLSLSNIISAIFIVILNMKACWGIYPPPQKFGFQLIINIMSIKTLIGAALLCSAFFISCHKEPQGMLLVAEGFGGGKATVEGNSSYWVDGEMVRINNSDYRVNVADVNAYATGVKAADKFYALYPNTLAPEADLTSGSVSVTIPSAYTYSKSGDLQRIDVPMAAYGTSDSRLLFKHLTAAVTVWVVNSFGIDIQVDSIVVTSSHYQISGNRSITFGNNFEIDTVETDTVADRRVVVRCNGGTTLKVNSGDSVAVQVPVLPVGMKNRFTITVAVHNADDAEMQYTFSRTQASNGHALLRAQIGYAPARFGGVFSVSANKKVRFAPGNLQYYCSSTAPQWRFAKHQYDVAAFDGSYYGANTLQWIDLFGFATSGFKNGRMPYFTYTITSSYNSSYDNISKKKDDWGWRNIIINGGINDSTWYTLTTGQWDSLTSTTNRPNKVGKGTIDGTHKGLIILPDDFTLPNGCNAFVSGGAEDYNNNQYTLEQWNNMEIAGAIFLPITGMRNGTNIENRAIAGFYWSATKNGSECAYSMKFLDSEFKHPSTTNYMGLAVRLVRDAN